MDQLYRHVKTGEVKPLPLGVWKAVKKNWVPVPESEIKAKQAEDQKFFEDYAKQHTAPDKPMPSVTTGKDIELLVESVGITETTPKESLQIAYETLSGEKADKRWNEKKLIQKIEELKETNK
jgi:hypothetical protein